MSEPFIAEIRIVGFNFAPQGWATCDGQILPISQNTALFSIVGTTYGGDGRTTFGLPDLRGRTPIHVGGGHPWAQKSGEESHSLQASEIPRHTHSLNASPSEATSSDPTGNVPAAASTFAYGEPEGLTNVKSASTGGGQAHNNMQPYLTLNFVIALQGLFPSRN